MNLSTYPHIFIQIASLIGRYGPVILFFLSLLFLSGKYITRDIYIVGFMVNVFVNSILKILIKQKRPNKYKSTTLISSLMDSAPESQKEKEKSVHRYGMPSGHAQTVSFSLAYISLVLNNLYISTAFLVFTVITCIQRVVFTRHYIDQVIIGAFVGCVMAYITYKIKNKIIEEKR
jgi:membrane-associated phospholipid phosphatase|tara:strand:- start:205 stop:729 length:525 start_codon:yes stop_codon:yes gene_type:complete